MSDQIIWNDLTQEQRNVLVAKHVMNTTRVRDSSLLPSKKQIPDYTTNLNQACLILLTFRETELHYQTQEDLGLVNVTIDGVSISFRGGAGEECAEAICLAALKAVGLDIHLTPRSTQPF